MVNESQEWPSAEDLGIKATTDALSLFGGWYFYFVDVVDRYLVFPQVKALFLTASIWLVISDIFIKIYKEKKYSFLEVKSYKIKIPIVLAILWTILSTITLICGISVYLKLDLLYMDPWRFFITFTEFMVVSYGISIILRRITRKINKYFNKLVVMK